LPAPMSQDDGDGVVCLRERETSSRSLSGQAPPVLAEEVLFTQSLSRNNNSHG
jgi:hypothetical protein